MDSFLPRAQVLEALRRLYDLSVFESEPTTYALVIESSEETRLSPGRSVWMMHIPDVELDGTGPWDPSANASSIGSSAVPSETVMTDMFAFFDAVTGDHLATMYIGPEG